MNKENILFIVEGESREMDIVNNISNVFFKRTQVRIIPIPAGKNIYMLWKQLQIDDFETDIIELLKETEEIDTSNINDMERDDFSEVYLFFDYDGHQNNLPNGEMGGDVLEMMLKTFDNETENGKLYISYPMVEALRDMVAGGCNSKNGCYISKETLGEYKHLSSQVKILKNQSKYNIIDWREIINIYALKVSCLSGGTKVIEYGKYKKSVTPLDVYRMESHYISRKIVFVLSAFPEFLLDYHRYSFWCNMIKVNTTLKGKGLCDN